MQIICIKFLKAVIIYEGLSLFVTWNDKIGCKIIGIRYEYMSVNKWY